MQRQPANPAVAIMAELKKNHITHVVWLPDSETNFLHHQLKEDPDIDLIPVSREAETIAIAAGLWVGGKRPVVLMQNSGFLESGDSVRGLGLDVNQPLLMLIGYRGWDSHRVTRDSAARFIEHILHAWGISYYLFQGAEDAYLISLALEEAHRTGKPVAVLISAGIYPWPWDSPIEPALDQ